jgi:hypothetical protein
MSLIDDTMPLCFDVYLLSLFFFSITHCSIVTFLFCSPAVFLCSLICVFRSIAVFLFVYPRCLLAVLIYIPVYYCTPVMKNTYPFTLRCLSSHHTPLAADFPPPRDVSLRSKDVRLACASHKLPHINFVQLASYLTRKYSQISFFGPVVVIRGATLLPVMVRPIKLVDTRSVKIPTYWSVPDCRARSTRHKLSMPMACLVQCGLKNIISTLKQSDTVTMITTAEESIYAADGNGTEGTGEECV